MLRMITLLCVAVLLAASCGDDGDDAVGSGPDDLPEPVCIENVEDPVPEYVGLGEAEATERAEDDGLQVRVVGRDGECFAVTMDIRDDRVNFEVADDVVIAAAIY